MGKYAKGASAFMRGFNFPDAHNSQEIEFEITTLQNKIASTKVNHILHLILSLITAGIWVIIWMFVTISASGKRASYQKSLKKAYQHKEAIINPPHKAETTTTTTTNTTEQLIKLSELLEKGLITKDEFEKQKASILN